MSTRAIVRPSLVQTVTEALKDAIEYRRDDSYCADCEPGMRCLDHFTDDVAADEYAGLLAQITTGAVKVTVDGGTQ